jgi:hypothetical protein
MKNLTPHQQQLVDEMIAEFSRINPKPSVDGKKRFSIALTSATKKRTGSSKRWPRTTEPSWKTQCQ